MPQKNTSTIKSKKALEGYQYSGMEMNKIRERAYYFG